MYQALTSDKIVFWYYIMIKMQKSWFPALENITF